MRRAARRYETAVDGIKGVPSMTGIALAAMLQLSVVSADASYAEAHKAMMETGRPMVILVGAEWCPACRTMKQDVTPEVSRNGGFKGATFAIVDTDQEPELAHKLMKGSSIPQLIVYRKTEEGWRINRMIGAQSPSTVEKAVALAVSDALDGPLDVKPAKEGAVRLTAAETEKEVPAVLEHKMKSLSGDEVDLSKYAGRVLLVVNTASECGYTPQYEGLQKLHEAYEEKGLSVLGFPCNQFGQQEPGDDLKIAQFCTDNYKVTFDMFSKVEVNGDGQCDFYKQLTAEDAKPAGKGPVKWNFEKFLIDREGKIIARFPSKVEPESDELKGAIEKALEAE
jgi:glutathione peroxidase